MKFGNRLCLIFVWSGARASGLEIREQVGRGFRKEAIYFKSRSLKDLPNPRLHPYGCGNDINLNYTVICDPYDGINQQLKNDINAYSIFPNLNIYFAVIGNMDRNNIYSSFFGDDITLSTFATSVVDKWDEQFRNSTGVNEIAEVVPVLVFLWLNDNVNMFSIVQSKSSPSPLPPWVVEDIEYDMYWLNYQQYWWFGAKKREVAIEEAVMAAFVQIDMHQNGGVSHVDSPFTDWYDETYKPSREPTYFLLCVLHRAWLWFLLGLVWLLKAYDYYLIWWVFSSWFWRISAWWYGTAVVVGSAEEKAAAVGVLLESLDERMRVANYYKRIHLSAECAVCFESFPPNSVVCGARIAPGFSDAGEESNGNSSNSSSGGSNIAIGVDACVTGEAAGGSWRISSLYEARKLKADEDEVPPETVHCRNPVVLSCGHVFGSKCLMMAFMSVSGAKCPICQKPALNDENKNGDLSVPTEVVRRSEV